MTAVSNRDLPIAFLLVDKETMVKPMDNADPVIELAIGSQPYKRVEFPITKMGKGWYRFIVPAKYIGGDVPILVSVIGTDTAEWRDSIAFEQFATSGGDLFEPEPLPDLEEPEEPETPPVIDPAPDGDYGEDVLYNAAWQFNDRSAGGSMTQNGNQIAVTIGPSNGQVRQLLATLSTQAGDYRMQIIGNTVAGNYNINPAIIMHVAPYEHLTDPTPLPSVQMGPDTTEAVLDFGLDPYDPARVRVIFPNTIPAGSVFTFDAITLRKKVS